MATSELKGELKYRDGNTKEFTVKAENNLKSLLTGLKKLNSEVSEVLTELVMQEKCVTRNNKGDTHVDDEEEDDSDEEEEETNTAVTSKTEPPTKRRKT